MFKDVTTYRNTYLFHNSTIPLHDIGTKFHIDKHTDDLLHHKKKFSRTIK